MNVTEAAYSQEWLALRAAADDAARATGLLDPLRAALPDRPLVIRDLGCGTGAMGRWLAGRLPGPQHWILHDRDPDLLAVAPGRLPATTLGGAPVTVTAEWRDVTRLCATDLAGTSLVTASALLDLLTADEVAELAAACVGAGCRALLALSVTGQVELTPEDPLDAEFGAAFNDHQRRTTGGRRLLGPDAPAVATAAFERLGASVHRAASRWRLGPDESALTVVWLRGRVAAAIEQRPDLAPAARDYLRRRLDACAEGRLLVTVGHEDLLAIPGGAR